MPPNRSPGSLPAQPARSGVEGVELASGVDAEMLGVFASTTKGIFASMITLILALIIAFIAIGIIGFVVHGLFWLFVVAAILFVTTLVLGGRHAGTRRRSRI
jgi:hypothetical protein